MFKNKIKTFRKTLGFIVWRRKCRNGWLSASVQYVLHKFHRMISFFLSVSEKKV